MPSFRLPYLKAGTRCNHRSISSFGASAVLGIRLISGLNHLYIRHQGRMAQHTMKNMSKLLLKH
jgi:hypothetical protein